MEAGIERAVPFLGAMRVDGLKNFFTVVTLRIFSLVFFSSNLEKGAREAGPCGGVDWAWGWGGAWLWGPWLGGPWLLAYAASSSRCNLSSHQGDVLMTFDHFTQPSNSSTR